MTNSAQLQAKKVSLFLSLFVIAFTIVGSYLFLNHQINLMKYSTPIILVLIVSILACGVLNRIFYQFLTKNEIYFSFGKQDLRVNEDKVSQDAVEQVVPSVATNEVSTTPPINITINLENTGTTSEKTEEVTEKPSSALDKFETLLEESQKQSAEKRIDIMNEVRRYTVGVMHEFLSKENVKILLDNINYLSCGKLEELKPIRSNPDKPLRSPDLRHFAWNIGQRLGTPMADRALFIKTVFPYELREATVQYLEKNLRDDITSKIRIDAPKKGDYHFKCMMGTAA